MQSVFWREVDLHTRSSGSCNAAANGHEPAANSANENRDSVAGHVSETHWIRHEHHAAADHQTGESHHHLIDIFWHLCKCHLANLA